MPRLDRWLFEKGFVDSREKARSLIMAGLVYVNGRRVDKAGFTVKGTEQIEVEELPKYVSRGGYKLENALRSFSINVKGKIALDVGSSTGGFTDCLLQHGAVRVYAVDVGKGQMHFRLRSDPRVILYEKTDARMLTDKHIPEKVDILTVDVSFISLTKVLSHVLKFLKKEGTALILIKPQFELSPSEVKKGIVKDKSLKRKALIKVIKHLQELGYGIRDLIKASPKGSKGNEEFFAYVIREANKLSLDSAVEKALRD